MSTNLNMKEKDKRAKRMSREDLFANRMFAAMGIAFLILLGLGICNMQSVRIQAGVAMFISEGGLFWTRVALGVLSAFAVAWGILRVKRGVKSVDRTVPYSVVAGIIVLFFGASLMFPTVFYTGLMAYFGVAFLLYAIHCIYRNGFFVFSLFMAIGTLLLYVASLPAGANQLYAVIKITAKVAVVALPVIVGVAALILKKKGGTVHFGKQKIRLLNAEDYLPLLAAAATLLVGAVLVLLFTGLLRLALMLLLAIFLIVTIIYTVKLV